MEKTPRPRGRHARRIDLDTWIDKERAASAEFNEVYDNARRATELARILAKLRRRRGLSQREVAERLGTSQQAISRIEHPDYRGHTLRMLARYAETLGARLEFRVFEGPAK